jgi:hypothetical protein
MRLQQDRSANRRTIRRAHANEQDGPILRSGIAEFLHLCMERGIAAISLNQVAKPVRLLAALDLKDLRTAGPEQLFGRFDAGNPAGCLLIHDCHSISQSDKTAGSFFN